MVAPDIVRTYAQNFTPDSLLPRGLHIAVQVFPDKRVIRQTRLDSLKASVKIAGFPQCLVPYSTVGA